MSPSHITGTVHTFSGGVVAGASVEARSIDHAGTMATVMADSRGNFALNLPPGRYDILVTDGTSQVSQQIEVGSFSGSEFDVRLPNKTAKGSSDPNAASVSVSQMSIPAKARADYDKAEQLVAKDNPKEAMKKTNQALEIAPHFAEARTLRGILYERSGELSQAQADYQQAIKDDPNYASGYVALGSLLNSTGHFTESIPVLIEAERLAPNSWQPSFELARARLGQGDFPAALQNVDRATEQAGGPAKQPAPMHLLRGFALLGLHEQARAREEMQFFLAQQSTGRAADAARRVLQDMDSQVAAGR
jgi:tetratricopeptide (TPR) repeat protein